MKINPTLSVESGKVVVLGTDLYAGKLSLKIEGPSSKGPKNSVLIVDVSYSTSSFNQDIINEVVAYQKGLRDGEYLTVIRYSGEGTAKAIVAPTRLTESRSAIERAIRSGLGLIGTTVFEEPLQLARKTVEALKAQDIAQIAILFTDGLPVPTRRSEEAEEAAALEAARLLGLGGVPLFVYGHGVYYNPEFMLALAERNGGGFYAHSSSTNDFHGVFADIQEAANKVQAGGLKLEIRADGKPVGRVFRTTPQLSLVGNGKSVVVEGLYENSVDLFFELPTTAKEIDVNGFINGKSIAATLKADRLSTDSQITFALALAAHAYSTGDMRGAVDTYSAIGAEELAIEAENSLAPNERRAFTARARSVVLKDPKKGIGKGFRPNDGKNLINLIIALVQDKGNVIIALDDGQYNRHTRKTVEPDFERDPNSPAMINRFLAHESHFNASIAGKIYGFKVDANGHRERTERDRTWSLFVHNSQHVEKISAKLTRDTFDKLLAGELIAAGESYSPSRVYEFDLTGLKFTSSRWNATNMNLAGRLKQDAQLTFLISRLNTQIKASKPKVEKEEWEKPYKEPAKDSAVVSAVTYKIKGYADAALQKEWDANEKFGGTNYSKSVVEAMTWQEAEKARSEVWVLREQVRFLHCATKFAMEAQGFRRYFSDEKTETRKGSAPRNVSTLSTAGVLIERRAWQETVEW